MTNETKVLVLRALKSTMGDNLYRAKAAWGHLTPRQMGEMYGKSGETRAAILAGYQRHHDKVTAAIKEVEAL